MSQLFKAKVRRVGTSVGILIPDEFVKKEKIKLGETLDWGMLRQKRIEEVLKLRGSAKGAQSFEREEEEDRV